MLIRCQNCDFRHGQMGGIVRQRLSERKKLINKELEMQMADYEADE